MKNLFTLSFLWALNDIIQKYRRSVLGPFWITVSTLIFIICLSLIYHKLFNMKFDFYILWISTGIIPWYLILIQVTEGMESIIEAENIIKSSPLNLNHVFLRITIRNFITFFHNFIIIFFLVIFFSKNIFIFLISIPLFVLSYFIILFPIGGILAILATRFRDVNSMVNSLIQVIFLSSPIIWHPTLIQGDMFKYLIELNPIYHFLEIFRSPIFYNLFPWKSYLIIILIGIALNIIFLYLYNKKKNQIIFWI